MAQKTLVILTVLALLRGILSPGMQAAVLTKLLPGRWMLYAGGGADIWEFHADGTCVRTGCDRDAENNETYTWRVEPATEEDQKKLWARPGVVLVIGDEGRFGLHFGWDQLRGTAHILSGGLISEEERAQAAALPLCISITFGEGGGGYVRMKDR